MLGYMIAGFIIIIGFLLFGIMSGGSILLFISLPSFLIVGGILIGGTLISFGLAVPLNALKEALLRGGVKSLDELKQYVNFFNLASQLSIAGGITGMLIGNINMLAHMSDPSTIGPNMAFALITALYGIVLSEFVFQPLKHALITKSAEVCENAADTDSGQSKNKRWLVLGLGLFTYVPFLTLLLSMSVIK
ncbi:MotA/TolQ/ExbB proton channel family protein [Candidatus Latescibacterota bacterium]